MLNRRRGGIETLGRPFSGPAPSAWHVGLVVLVAALWTATPPAAAQEAAPNTSSPTLTDHVERARRELARRLRERAQELEPSEDRGVDALTRHLRERGRELEGGKDEPSSTGSTTGASPVLVAPAPLPQARAAGASLRPSGAELGRLFDPTPLGRPERLRETPETRQARAREPNTTMRRPQGTQLEAALQPPSPPPAAPAIPIAPQAAPAPAPPAAPEKAAPPPPHVTAALPEEAEPPANAGGRHVSPVPRKRRGKPGTREEPARPVRSTRTEEPSLDDARDADVEIRPAPRRTRGGRVARTRTAAPETTGSIQRRQRSSRARPAPSRQPSDIAPLITLPEALRPTRPPAGSLF